MSLLHDLIQEMAAGGSIGADSVANVPGSLFAGGIVNPKKIKTKQRKMMRRIMNMKESLGVDLGRNEFDASDVISKIDAAGKKAEQNDDTTPFGLEDEDGNIVKVYVKNDQAEEFEKELAAMLAGEDNDDDDKNSALEIAEVLFKLKDKFDIIDVEWPGIEGDVEEEQEATADLPAAKTNAQGGMTNTGIEGDADNLTGFDDEGKDVDDGEMIPDESGAESALTQVIDMMKADAEAKKAEADARAAEARAKEAEYTAQASSSRVKKDEQIYDMENAEKEQKDQEKEAQQQAKLARYQYNKASDAEVKLSMGESESFDEDDEVTLKELSELILRNLGNK